MISLYQTRSLILPYLVSGDEILHAFEADNGKMEYFHGYVRAV